LGNLRQSTNGFNQQRQILLASHPALQTYTRAMSVFGHVASTALSVMNALNIASLNNNTASQGLRDAELELIEARKELARLDEAGLGGTIQWELQKQKVEELTRAVEEHKKAVVDAARQTKITMITAWVNIAASVGGQILDTIVMIKLMQAQGLLTANTLRVAFSTVFLPLLIGLAAVVAGWYIAARIIETLFPAAFKTMNASIKESWGIDDPTGMIAVAVAGYLGWIAIFNDLKLATNETVEFIWDAFRELIKALSFGFIQLPPIKITGVEPTQTVLDKEKERLGIRNFDNYMPDLEHTRRGPATALGLEVPELNALRKQLEEDQSIAESRYEVQMEQLRQEQKALEVEREAIKVQIESKKTLDSTDQDIIVLESTISDLDTKIQIVSNQLKDGIPIDVNISGGTTKYASGNKVDQEWAANYLAGLGSTTSTGSNVSTNQPNDYYNVVSTRLNSLISAFRTANGREPTREEVNTLSMKAGQMTRAASGFEGMVSKPTTFLTGEAGPEMVSIKPLNSMNKSSGTIIIQNITVQGSILAEREVERIADRGLKRDLKRVGF